MAADLNLDTAIEEAARCMWEDIYTATGNVKWDDAKDSGGGRATLVHARQVIEAALPHILEAVACPFDVDDPHAMIYMSEAAAVIRRFSEKRGGGMTPGTSNDPPSIAVEPIPADEEAS